MENAGRKAKILAAVFVSVAALGAGYYYRNDITYELCALVHPAWNAGEQRLADAYGRRYTLMNGGDGTETALYDDDTAVTFRRDEAGNLIWEYGTASLLAPIAANYFAFHGIAYPGGAMDVAAMTYRPAGTLEALPAPPAASKGVSRYHGGAGRGYWGRSGTNYDGKKSGNVKQLTRKSGFGRAGVRSSGHGS